jgi:sugar phosphate isomerase/epimerase
MPATRRNFLKTGTLAIGASLLFPKKIFAGKKTKRILGIQLYTVREDMKTDPSGTLQQLSKMGYKHVEHANYVGRKFYGYSAKEFKKLLDDLGLKMLSGHTVMSKKHWDPVTKDFTNEWKFTIEDAAVAGQQFVISPSLDQDLRKNYDDLLRFMDLFNKSGELCKKSGLKFGYHNHAFEFKYSVNNMKMYDVILKNTDPTLVLQQLDIGNMYGAGGRAEQIIKDHPGRFESMHVKDEIITTKKEIADGYESTILGEGVLNVKHIIDVAKRMGGTIHFIIEQESYQDKTPMECAKKDLHIMKKWGY